MTIIDNHSHLIKRKRSIEFIVKNDELAQRLERYKGMDCETGSDWVAMEEECYKLTIEALVDVDVDDGRVIDHQSVQVWVIPICNID